MVGTFLCGPEALGEVLAKKCAKYSDVDPRKTKFYFNKENFWEPRLSRKTGSRRRFAVRDGDKTWPITAVSHRRPYRDYGKRLTVTEFKVGPGVKGTTELHPKSLAFIVIWNYYPYLVLSICLSEDKAGRCVWDDVTFLHSSWGTYGIQSNYVSPVKFAVTWFRTFLKSLVGDHCCYSIFVNKNVLTEFL